MSDDKEKTLGLSVSVPLNPAGSRDNVVGKLIFKIDLGLVLHMDSADYRIPVSRKELMDILDGSKPTFGISVSMKV